MSNHQTVRDRETYRRRCNQEVTRQAATIADIDDIALMLSVILLSFPLLLLVRGPRRQPVPAAADD